MGLVPAYDQIADLRFASMDKSIIEPGHILRIAEDQAVMVTVCHHLVEKRTHFLRVSAALLHVYLRPLKELTEKSHA